METHDSYFSWVVALIPKDLYKSTGDENHEYAESKYYKHRKVPLKPEEKKAISRAKKHEVYSRQTNDDEENIEDDNVEQKATEGAGREEEEIVDKQEKRSEDEAHMMDQASNNLESLRKRLQMRILGLQSQRMGKKSLANASEMTSKTIKKENQDTLNASKHKFSSEHRNAKGMQRSSAIPDHSASSLSFDSTLWPSNKKIEQEYPYHESESKREDADLDVNNILESASDPSSKKDSMAGKPGTKMLRLKRMLNEATKKRQRLETLAQEGEQGKKRAREEAWTDALKSASGEKIALDPGRLKKAIKRREKQKERSSEEWRDRKESIEENKNMKAEKREANILHRKQGGGAFLQSQSAQAEKERDGGGGRRNKFTERIRNERIEENKAGGDKKRPGFEGKKGAFLNSQKGREKS